VSGRFDIADCDAKASTWCPVIEAEWRFAASQTDAVPGVLEDLGRTPLPCRGTLRLDAAAAGRVMTP
jgi:hypothetical protein